MTHRAFFDFLGSFSCGFYVAEIAQVNVTFRTTEISIMATASITLPKHAKITQLNSTTLIKRKREFKLKGETTNR